MHADSRITLRRERVVASWLVASVSTVVAALGHVIAGGASPSLPAIAGAALLSGWVGMLVVGRRLTRARTAAGVAVDQLIFHLLFSFFGTSPSGTAAVPSTGTHHHDVAHATLASDVTGSIASLDATAMVANHSLAAVLAYVLLRVGVQAVARCLHTIVGALRRLVTVPDAAVAAVRPRSIVARFERVRPTRRGLVRLPDRRGPPLAGLAV